MNPAVSVFIQVSRVNLTADPTCHFAQNYDAKVRNGAKVAKNLIVRYRIQTISDRAPDVCSPFC